MKKLISLVLAALMALTLFAACGKSDNGGSTDNKDNAEVTGTVSTDGSTSMEKVIGALSEQFMADNSGVSVTYDPTGSGAGIEAAGNGSANIGLASRALKDEEKAAGLTETILCYDGIAVLVNPENTVEVKDKCQYRQELSSTGDVITTVAQNPGAIGYASLASVKDTVKAVKIGGVAPSEGTVKDGTYAIQRPIVLATKTDAKLNDAAQAFFDYVTSADANEIIVAAGVVPAT